MIILGITFFQAFICLIMKKIKTGNTSSIDVILILTKRPSMIPDKRKYFLKIVVSILAINRRKNEIIGISVAGK